MIDENQLAKLLKENKIAGAALDVFNNEPVNKEYAKKFEGIDNLILKCKEIVDKGIKAILIFGVSKLKDSTGDIACMENNIVQRALKALKDEKINLLLIADVCNCEYTSHGHCGTIVNGDVENDLTLNTLAKQSVSLAEAGADVIAPSDMMDGRVKHIRSKLDESGYYKIPILSYSVKYASSFYSPFRDAADSAPQGFDRKTYQMNYSNVNEAIRERVAQLGIKIEDTDDKATLLEKEKVYNEEREKIEYALESFYRSAHSLCFQINKRYIPKYLSIMRVVDRRFETGEIFIKWDDTNEDDWLILIYIKNNSPDEGIVIEDRSNPERNFSHEFKSTEIFKASDLMVDSLTKLLDRERNKKKVS